MKHCQALRELFSSAGIVRNAEEGRHHVFNPISKSNLAMTVVPELSAGLKRHGPQDRIERSSKQEFHEGVLAACD